MNSSQETIIWNVPILCYQNWNVPICQAIFRRGNPGRDERPEITDLLQLSVDTVSIWRGPIFAATFDKYKAKFGGMDVSDAHKLKVFEAENARLKKLLAEKMLDNAMLKDVASKNGKQ
ncbi:hypothetical protein [Roseibium sp.]|uniref:hypothetical protein n=1 Tax=Roseibium sp. TaxID=1936156 RepID=UPI003D0ED6C4